MDITLFKKTGALYFKKISSRAQLTDLDVDGFLIDSDEKEVRRILDVLKAKKEKKLIAVKAKDDDFNRRIIETTKVNFLVSPELNQSKDSIKQRDSGLNHVVANAAAKNNIPLLIDFSAIFKLASKEEKSKTLARIMQNLVLCRKSNCKIKIATFAEEENQCRTEGELKSFLFSLGASSQQTTEACKFN